MKTRLLLLAFSLLAGPVFAGQPVFEESIVQLPRTPGWKTQGAVEVQGDKLVLRATGDEGAFANGVLLTTEPSDALNFTEHPLQIRVSGIELSGDAPDAKKAFVILLSTDKALETSAAAYVRFCLNGDGSFNVAGPKSGGGEGVVPVDLVTGKVVLPVSSIMLSLSRDKVIVKIKDGAGDQEFQGEIGDKMELSLWQGMSPYFVLKAVRRPAAGYFEASVAGLEIFSEK